MTVVTIGLQHDETIITAVPLLISDVTANSENVNQSYIGQIASVRYADFR